MLDAFAQNNGHLGITDARYLNAVKLFLTGISPLEYQSPTAASAAAGRNFPGVGPRVACLMQSIDEVRHAQTQIHALSNYNKFYEGFHAGATHHDRTRLVPVGAQVLLRRRLQRPAPSNG